MAESKYKFERLTPTDDVDYEDDIGIFSVLYFPETDELFTALRGEGATRNGTPIHAANRPAHRAIISFGDFVRNHPELISLEQKIMDHTAANVEKIRMFGAASIDYAYAACGRIDGNFTFVKNVWDILPGILLCREAGLMITDACGKPYIQGSKTAAVFSTPEILHACIPASCQ